MPESVSSGSRVSASPTSGRGTGPVGAGLRAVACVRRHRWLAVIVLVVAVAMVLAGAVRPLRLAGRMLGRGVTEPAVHVVQRGTLSVTLKEDGELKPVHSVDIVCEVPGGDVTIQWVIEESTRVSTGDLLLRLTSADLKQRLRVAEMDLAATQAALAEAEESLAITRSENESRLDKARIDLEVARLELQRYLEGDYQKALQQIQINIQQTEMEIRKKEEELRNSEVLLEKKFISRAKFEELRDALERARMTRDMHLLERRILEEYEKPKNQLQKEAAVRQAEEELQREQQRCASREKQAVARFENQRDLLAHRQETLETLRRHAERCEIRAPGDGIVQYAGGGWRWGSERIAVGQRVYEGQTLLTLPDTAQMKVVTRIHEADRHKVREGLFCLVSVPAVPDRTLTGRLTKIAQFADSERSWWNPELKEHATEILLDDNDAPLSPGDTAHIEIFIEDVPDVLAVPVQCVFVRGSKRYVFVWRDGVAQPVEVQLGRSSPTMIEVTGGLAEGDKVVLAPDERALALLPGPGAQEEDARASSARARRAMSQPTSSPSTMPAATGPASQPSAAPSSAQPATVPTTEPASATGDG